MGARLHKKKLKKKPRRVIKRAGFVKLNSWGNACKHDTYTFAQNTPTTLTLTKGTCGVAVAAQEEEEEEGWR